MQLDSEAKGKGYNDNLADDVQIQIITARQRSGMSVAVITKWLIVGSGTVRIHNGEGWCRIKLSVVFSCRKALKLLYYTYLVCGGIYRGSR